MQNLGQAIEQVLKLLLTGNQELYGIIFLSIRVSITAVFLGMLLGIPFASFLAFKDFKGKKIIINILHTLMGLPPVLAGLIVYFILSRKGPLGDLGLLFTAPAMICAQFLLTLPIITGLSMVSIKDKAGTYQDTAISLGASYWQMAFTVMKEAQTGIYAALTTAFGRAIAEVGAVMLVGGNIAGHTRVMTTAIVMETRQGNYLIGLSLGLVLLLIAFIINCLLNLFQREV